MTIITCPNLEISKEVQKKIPAKIIIDSYLKGKSEACSHDAGVEFIQSQFHPLLSAVHISFAEHYPLKLTPDMIWLTIVQGFANHINMNAEKYRSRFVSHSGKQTIVVDRDEFVRFSPDNDWQGVFGEFSTAIKGIIGENNHSLVVDKFSTSTVVTIAAFEVVLMDSMKSYFDYVVRTRCGIPYVQLEGSVDDYEKILSKLDALAVFDLKEWIDLVKPIIQNLINTMNGKIDSKFWGNIYKHQKMSGSEKASGWITKLIPYLQKSDGTIYVNEFNDNGVSTNSFPSGLAKVPFIWKYFGADLSYEFFGGFVGVSQDNFTKTLTPEIGWAVKELKA